MVYHRYSSPYYHIYGEEYATEAPFNNEYDNFFEKGIDVYITTGEPLFMSSSKFNSAAFKFIPMDKMKELGYEEYLDELDS